MPTYPELRPLPPSDTEPSSSSSSPPLPKPRATAIACDQCRKARSKCDGTRPSCGRCTSISKTCVYAGGPDETRVAALKRTAKTYEEKLEEYQELYKHLRSRPEMEAVEILRRLRISADVSSVLRFIRDGDLIIQNFSRPRDVYDVNVPRSQSPLQVELAMQYPNVYLLDLPEWWNKGNDKISAVWRQDQDVNQESTDLSSNEETMSLGMKNIPTPQRPVTIDFARFPDERLFKATCNPWTSVISDDHLFRTLISIYLTWTHPTHTVFDKDCFLDDLVSHGDRFCSPMLVNAILSYSFFSYIQLDTPRGTRADTSLGFAFLKEARRLWQLHEGSQTLTMLQAVILIAFTYNNVGRDRLGFTFCGSALAMATDMDLMSRTEARNGDQELFFVEQTTVWGLFYLLNTTCFGLRKRALFRAPPAGPLPEDIRTASSNQAPASWTPYPYTQFSRPISIQDLFNANVAFWKIGMEIVASYMDAYSSNPNSGPTMMEAEDFYSRLLAWSQSIPDSLIIKESSLPFVLILHSWFHIVVIELFRPFKKQKLSRSKSISSPDSRADAISAESVRQLKILTVTMATRYDCRLVSLTLLQSTLTLCFDTKRDLYDDESARVFTICFNLLYDYSHSLPYIDIMLRLLKDSVNQSYRQLPPVISETFSKTPELKQVNSSHQEIQSSYPIDFDNLGGTLEATRLDSIILNLSKKNREKAA